MDIKNMLILSPTTLTFQAPFPFYQKRQLSLLNLSEKIMVYSIEVDNPKLFEVMPLRGVLNTYATIELAILMKPGTGNLPASRLTVKYMEKPENCLENLPQNWSGAYTAQVDMLLMNYVAEEKDLKNMAVDGEGSPDLDDLIKRLQRYKPVCTNCCLKRNIPKANESKSRLKQLFGHFAWLLYQSELLLPINVWLRGLMTVPTRSFKCVTKEMKEEEEEEDDNNANQLLNYANRKQSHRQRQRIRGHSGKGFYRIVEIVRNATLMEHLLNNNNF